MLSSWPRPVFLVAVVAIVGVAYVTATNTYNGDSYLSFHTAQSMVHDRDLYLDEMEPYAAFHYGLVPTKDDHSVDLYPWGPAVMAVPSVLALDALEKVGIGPRSLGVIQNNQMTYISMANGALATLIAVGAVTATAFAIVVGDERRRRRVALVVGLGFALGTTAWSMASRANWQHGASMAMSSIAVLAATRLVAGRHPAWAVVLGAGAGAAYTCRPTNLVLLVILGVWVLLAHPLRAPLAAVGAWGVLGPWVVVNQVTYGTALTPYHDPGRGTLGGNLAERMATQLFSPSRGLLVFSPIVVLAVVGWWRAVRREPGTERLGPGLALALGLAAGGHWVAVSSQDFGWWGGVGFGPRFMTDALPWLAVLAVPAVDQLLARAPEVAPSTVRRAGRALAAAALLWSVVVHAQGAYVRSTVCWNFDPDVDAHRVWQWDESQLFAGIGSLGEAPVGSLLTEPCDRLPRT